MYNFEVLSFKENDERRLHFLTGLEEAVEVPFHWDYDKRIDSVCELFRGQNDCNYCKNKTERMKNRTRYAFFVYDLDTEAVGIICTLDSDSAMLPLICNLDDEVGGNLAGTTFSIDRTGYTKDSVFFGYPIDDEPGEIKDMAHATEDNLKMNVFKFWDELALTKK